MPMPDAAPTSNPRVASSKKKPMIAPSVAPAAIKKPPAMEFLGGVLGEVIARLCHVPRRYASVPQWDRRNGPRQIVYLRLAHLTVGAAIVARRLLASRVHVRGKFMSYLPYLANKDVNDAAELIAVFGDDAGFEAAARADKSRDVGNYINFCRWRQIERLIILLSVGRAVGTIH